jgi:SAM-dependent methyltransferase
VPASDARRALAPVPIGAIAHAGLIEHGDGMARALIRVLPYEELLVACDRDPELDGRLERDHVGGIHASSVLLARITPRRHVERALDIGCGCGFQALLLALHARTVVATDVNRRALEFARLNAELNGVENIDWRHGDGLEPVRGERFDLVVSNPPYVIAPRPRFLFRESPAPGDAFCEQLVRGTPSVLADEGAACLLASWIVTPDEQWSARPAAWTREAGPGRLLIHLETVDAATNAVRWAAPPGVQDREEAAARVAQWLEHYRARGIRAVAYGAVILDARAALRGWQGRIELPGTPGPEAGAQIERMLDGHALLAGGSTAAWLDAVLTLPAGHRLDWTLGAQKGEWQLRRTQLSVEGGLGIAVELDRATARLLAQLDGRRTLRELFDADPSADTDALLERLARLLRAGLIGVKAGLSRPR